ncbi:MAG: helix-turn-helix transcriptional regulator [Pseudomonadota bacterium]
MNSEISAAEKAKRIFAWNIRVERAKLRISQEKLAEKAEISRTFVGQIENCDSNMTINVMGAIADALDIPLEKLLTKN